MLNKSMNIICAALFTLSVAGRNISIPNFVEPQSTEPYKVDSESDGNSEAGVWKEAYAKVLRDVSAKSNAYSIIFSLWDLDNDGIPELLIFQDAKPNGQDSTLSVYSYNGSAYKLGDYRNAQASFLCMPQFSSNPMYPGLFDFCQGWGDLDCTYLTVKEGKLVVEPLWHDQFYDSPNEPPLGRTELSADKGLMNEGDILAASSDNTIEQYFIDNDSIAEVLGEAPNAELNPATSDSTNILLLAGTLFLAFGVETLLFVTRRKLIAKPSNKK